MSKEQTEVGGPENHRTPMEEMTGLRDDVYILHQSINGLAKSITGDTHALQLRMDLVATRLIHALESNTTNLVQGLDRAAAAANKAAAASEKHAQSLAWATWALVVATVMLAVLTWKHGPV